MKNLKKVLALGLALVMLLGMFSVVSAAETEKFTANDLYDFEDVVNKDAVALAVDLQIIDGIPDDSTDPDSPRSYKPNAPITRAAWAKLVYSAITGSPEASEFEDASLNPFSDVVADHWALGHIVYLNSMGYIVGDGTGRYNPDHNVTVVEAYKTMLVALGYVADREGYANNDNWVWNISRAASANGLTVAQKTGENLTRDNAAQLIFNALNAQMVYTAISYQDGKPVYGDVTKCWDTKPTDANAGDPLTLGENIYGLTPVEAQVVAIDADGNATLSNNDYSGKLPATADQLGMNVVLWTDKAGNLISSVLATGSTVVKKVAYDWDKAAYTLATDDTAGEDGAKDASWIANLDAAPMYVLNGAASTKAEVEAAIISGNKVELLIANGGDEIDVVRVTEIKAYKAAAPATRTTNKGVDQVKITGVNNGAWTDAANVNGASDVAEGDIILVSKSGSVWTVEKAECIEGAVTGFSATSVTVKGVTLSDAATILEGSDVATVEGWNPDKTGDYTFYLDKAGNVIFVKAHADAASTTDSKLALLSATGYVAGGQSLEASDDYWQAQIINLDGSKETMNNVIGTGWDEDDEIVAPNTTKDWAGAITAPVLPLVRVTTTEDGTIIEVLDSEAIGDADNLEEVSASINFIEGDVATKATNFIIWNTTTKAYEFKTGYASLASFNAYGYKTEADEGTYVYLITDGSLRGTTSETAEYVWLTSLEWKYENGAYVYAVIDAEGNEETITATAQLEKVEVGFAMITARDEKGNVTGIENVEAPNTAGAKYKDGIFTVDGETWFEIDDYTVCLLVDVDSKGALVDMGGFDPATIDLSVVSEDDADEGTFQAVYGVAYGSDGKEVASGATADLVIIWRVALAEEA